MRMKRPVVGMCLLLVSLSGLAQTSIPCQIELGRGNCWKNHDVTLYVLQRLGTQWDTSKLVMSKTDPLVKVYSMRCKANHQLTLKASFLPAVWSGSEGEQYKARSVWNVPQQLPEGQVSWKIRVCFSTDFRETPTPITSGIPQCECVFPEEAGEK